MGKKDSFACLWAGTLAFPAFRLSLEQQLGSQTCWLLDWNSKNEPSKFLGLWTQSGATYTLVLLSFQLTACRPWDTSGSVIVKSIPYHISFLCIHVCICLTYKIVCVCVLTLCNPTDCSLPGSSVHGIFQARILEWLAKSSSRGSSRPRDRTHVSSHLLHWQAGSLPPVPSGKPTYNRMLA